MALYIAESLSVKTAQGLLYNSYISPSLVIREVCVCSDLVD